MKKLILLSIVVGSFIYAGNQGNLESTINQDSANKQYNWSENTSDDDFKLEAGRRRGKGSRGDRFRGGSGLK